jgi:hypothetical protein
MVWCLATVTAILAVTVGAGWALGNLSKIVGGGLSAVGKPIAAATSGAADLAKDAADRNKGMVSSFIDEAVSARAQGKTETDAIRARRDLGMALSRLVAGGDTTAEANKQAIVDVLTRDLGVPDADARRMADDWTASVQKLRSQLDEMKQKAETRAREAAEKSSKALSIMSLGSFVAFMIGAIFAAWGGRHGGATAYRRSEGNEVGVE